MGHTHHSRGDADNALFLEVTRDVTLRSCLRWVRTHLGDCSYTGVILNHLGLAALRFKRSKQARDSQADSFWVPRIMPPDACHGLVGRLVLPHDFSAPGPGTGCPSPPAVSGVPSLECPSGSDLSATESLRESVSEPRCHDSVAARQTVCAHVADTVVDDAAPGGPRRHCSSR